MVHAKNYETVSTFVEVMQKKLWLLFFRTQCICTVNKGRLAGYVKLKVVTQMNLLQAININIRNFYIHL